MIKFKDLYVSLAPADQNSDERLKGIFQPAVNSTAGCPWILKGLKDDLMRALSAVKALEKQETPRPKVVSELKISDVEMLEGKLRGALDELHARKAKLKNKAA